MAGVLMVGELIKSYLIEARKAMVALALGKLVFSMTQDAPSLADGAVDSIVCTDDLLPTVIEDC